MTARHQAATGTFATFGCTTRPAFHDHVPALCRPWMIAVHPSGPNSLRAAMALRTDFVAMSAATVRSGRRTLSNVRG